MNKRGFTLVELVVAIAALALCSGFILSMYFKSDELADDADLYDEAMSQTSFIAETFKASTDTLNFAENLHLQTEKNVEEHVWRLYYNENWFVEENADNAYVELIIELTPEQKYDSGTLYKLNLNFFKIASGSREQVVSMVCKKYYPGGAR